MTYLHRGAGRLTKRVTIQKRIANETNGADDPYYEDIKTVSASFEPLAGRELFAAQQVNSQVNSLVRIRFVDWLTAAHRLCYYDKRRAKYVHANIERVADDPRSSGTYLDLYVTEWVEAPAGANSA